MNVVLGGLAMLVFLIHRFQLAPQGADGFFAAVHLPGQAIKLVDQLLLQERALLPQLQLFE
jgi:hypothetical protein